MVGNRSALTCLLGVLLIGCGTPRQLTWDGGDGAQPSDASGAGDTEIGPDTGDASGNAQGEGPPSGAAPAAPDIDGEESAGHLDLTWLWTVPPGTESFRYRLNGASSQDVPASVTSFSSTVPQAGSYTLAVQACNSAGCSPAAQFTTVVEMFGGSYPPIWRGVARTNLTTSPLGNVAALSCHNCYNGPNNEVFDVATSQSKMRGAISRQADLIEIDIASIGGALYATHDDVAAPEARPPLADLLADESLQQASAMLFIEVKEIDLAPEQFAATLVSLLDANRAYARNGRWLFIRGFDSRLAYLTAIQDEVNRHPFIKPYVKYTVLYGRGFGLQPATAHSRIQQEVVANGFHGAEFDFQDDNLFSLIGYARGAGLIAAVYTIPAYFGEVFTAAMREDVDVITTDYRADYARFAIEHKNAGGYVNAAAGATASVAVRQNLGTLIEVYRTLGLPATPSRYGTPELSVTGAGGILFGGTLVYAAAEKQAIELFDLDANPNEGVLVTSVVKFGTVTPTETQAILNKSEFGGYVLELGTGTAGAELRFGVWPSGASYYTFHTYPAAGVPSPAANACNAAGQFAAPLSTDASYFLIGAYDGSGGVYLWINNRCAAVPAFGASGGVTGNDAPALVGADPELNLTAQPTGARSHFTGSIQQAQMQRWGAHLEGTN